MPIYEYECAKCGHRLEAIQRFSDAPLTECPECKEAALERLISPAAFHLKGTGWYATDFRGDSRGGAKKAGGNGKEDGGGKSASKGESKSDSKAKSSDSSSKAGAKSSTSTAD